jgi:hypothetical protein
MNAAIKVPVHAWIVPGSLAIAERPGGGGRSHRVARRQAELTWWSDQGVRTIVSAMRSRHCITEYAQHGFGVRWHPLKDVVQACKARLIPQWKACTQTQVPKGIPQQAARITR